MALIATLAACSDTVRPPVDAGPPERAKAGGETTVEDVTSHAFSTPSPNLSGERLDRHLDGDLAFEQIFVRPPAAVNPGLGPVFNAPSCDQCHDRDGRTREAALMRLSLPGTGPDGGPLPVPGFGGQLQDDAVFDVSVEGRFVMDWVEVPGSYGDGSPFSLRRPSPSIVDPHVPLPGSVYTSVRMPRPVFGLGLLEAITEATMMSLADPEDLDGDGISGRVNRVMSVPEGRMVVGRFGWKANQPSLLQQTAAAYREDMGVTNTVFPTESVFGQGAQDDGRDDDPELPDEILAAATFYVQTLGVPAPRRLDDPTVLAGEALFTELGCAACHIPRLETGVLADVPEVSSQVIYPYTDLLLHDMGPGLADGRPDWLASEAEWRTPPLWGLGLTSVVNGHTDLLHDGRARSLAEAVLWHGGEAEAAKEDFRLLPAAMRNALIAFLEAL